MEVTCLADVKALLGEGPTWDADAQALTFVDIKGRRAFRWSEEEGLEEFATPFRLGSLIPRASGGHIAGSDRGIIHVNLDHGRFELLFDPEEERDSNRFNDAKVDRAGRLFAGTMDDEEKAASGAFYRIEKTLTCTRVDDGYRVTNGPAFSPDGKTMYANDSALQVTYRYDLAPDGTPLNRREFARFGEGEGYPDGMTVDADDCLWIAFWDGWCVRRYSPEGNCLELIGLPVQKPTSCAFGGPDLRQLYVTSASAGLTEEERSAQPCAGGLFMLDTPYAGLEDIAFEG